MAPAALTLDEALADGIEYGAVQLRRIITNLEGMAADGWPADQIALYLSWERPDLAYVAMQVWADLRR